MKCRIQSTAAVLYVYCNLRCVGETPLETPLTVKRAAERLDVHEETVRRWIKKGELKAIQVGRVFVITEESMQAKEERLKLVTA